MPEWHTNVQENATPSDASATTSSELPTVESIFTRSRNLRCKACHSTSYWRVVLAALASVAAVVVLVFSCSHVYRRRAVQDFRTRRLASSDDSNASFDVCGEVGGEEEQQQREHPRLLNLPAGDERKFPLKKRLLASVTAAATGSSTHEGQQQGKQHNMNEAAGIQSGLQAPQALQKQEQLDPMPILVGSPLSSAQERAQGELDAAAGLLSLIGSQDAAGHFASGARQSTSSEVLRQRRRTRRMEQKVQRERSSMQRQLLRLKQQIKSERRLRQQLQAQMQKARKHQAHQQPWQQQQQQQQQQQYLPRQQAHSPQRPLHQPQPPPLLQHDQEKRQRLMQEQHVMPVEEGTRQHTQRKRRREQQGELQPREEEQHQSWQHGNQLPGHLMEDEWLEQELPIAQAPQPSTSQQALQHSTAGAAARRSTSEDRSTQVIPLELADNAATSASASDGSSRDSADIAPAAGPAAGAAVASAGDARELQAAVSSADESPTQGASMNIEMRTVLGLHTHGSADSTGAAAAGTAATAATGSAIAASSSTSASTTLLEERASDPDAVREHPFVRLPRRAVSVTPETHLVDLRRAVTIHPGRRDGVRLLHTAHDLLLRRVLYLDELKELARVTAGMIEYAVNHHRLDLTHFQPSRALDRMGMRFLLMDAVVSAFIVLGQTPRARDWKIFTDSIGHGHPAGYFLGRRPGRVTSGSFLGRDLSRAIQMLKAGIRPAPADLVNLKRALICSPSSPARFRKPDFDRWREDDVSPTPGQ